jgi:hypothetical protein
MTIVGASVANGVAGFLMLSRAEVILAAQ